MRPVLPIAAALLAFTAIPFQIHAPAFSLRQVLSTDLYVYDLVVNIAGFLPLGVALAPRNARTVLVIAAALSTFAEFSQLFTPGRATTLLDVATNVIGTLIGWSLARRWRVGSVAIEITRPRAIASVILAIVSAVLMTRVTPVLVEDSIVSLVQATYLKRQQNPRGVSSPGILEAHWTFDDAQAGLNSNDRVTDVTAHGIQGTRINGAMLDAGVLGSALRLNGKGQYVEIQDSEALRLSGSMTIGAWINADSFTPYDAVIASNFGPRGFQLDASADQGARTIAFRVTNGWGLLTSRFATTEIGLDRWYHVAGVYDAPAQTMSVYINGMLDNGCLFGTVTGQQTPSEQKLYFGRSAQPAGFWFSGAIDDLRIYSRALTGDEIRTEMVPHGTLPTELGAVKPRPSAGNRQCASTQPRDSRSAGLIVAFGMLVSFGCAGLWRAPHFRWAGAAASLVGGVLVAPAFASSVPGSAAWLVPVLSLVGGAVVAVATRADSSPDATWG